MKEAEEKRETSFKHGHFRIMVLAGEVSGDMYAAGIIEALRTLPSFSDAEFFGIGGDKMRAAGVELFADVSQTGVMGIWEVAKRWRFFYRLLRDMKELMRTRRPDLLLTIDYPGFNLRMASEAKKEGIRAVHYICPQVWAWHKNRIPSISRSLDRLITVFPFEPELFEGTHLRVSFAGHPLVDCVRETLSGPVPVVPWGDGVRLALLPGSRKTEISRLLPLMVRAAKKIEDASGPCSFIIPVPGAVADFAKRILLSQSDLPTNIFIFPDSSRFVLAQARAAIVKSGTSTLEASLARCPFIIVYKVSRITFEVGKLLVKGIKNIGLVNILAGREVCPELLQNDATPEKMAELVCEITSDGARRDQMLRDLDQVNEGLGEAGALLRAAEIVAEEAETGAGRRLEL